MVDVGGLPQGRLGKVRITPDGIPGDPVEIEFQADDERLVTEALHQHNNRVRLRVRGHAELDERGRLKRFIAKRVREVRAPDPDAFSEAYFERLTTENPTRLVELLLSGELEPTLLTFAAEIAGRGLASEQVIVPLLRLLKHERAVVREGAIYGLRDHMGNEITAALRLLAESDESAGVRAAAKGALKSR